MNFIWNISATGNIIATLVVLTIIEAIILYSFLKTIKRVFPLAIMIGSTVFVYVGYLLCLDPVMYLSMGVELICALGSIIANLGDFRKYIANPFRKPAAKQASYKVEKIFDSKAMYKQIEDAVLALSRSKTGAIITFERNTPLGDLLKNGVVINAPVTSELLQTIFYPGTRLHDGAVVIHGDKIIAASVFFTPTTKAYAGKYGSRHRAAIGISEICDAVTIVVSEETGRISFAINGQLESVDQSTFLRAFENYMSQSKD